MARQRRNIEALKRGMFGKEIADNSQKRKHDIRNNEMVDIAEKYVDALPAFLKKPGAQEGADIKVDRDKFVAAENRKARKAGLLAGGSIALGLAHRFGREKDQQTVIDQIIN